MRLSPLLVCLLFACSAASGDEVGDTEAAATAAPACVVKRPPAELGLDPFYTKYCSARGIPVVAHASVSDAAVQQAARVIGAMIERLPSVPAGYKRDHVRFGIVGAHQLITDMPEYAFPHLPPTADERMRGLADTPLSSDAEENVLCWEQDRWRRENIMIHEFAHTVQWYMDARFQERVDRAYDAALGRGLYRDLYAGTNQQEYWAEGVQNFFGVHAHGEGEPGPITADDLRAYDPELYGVIADVFRGVRMPPVCPAPSFRRDAWYRVENVFHDGFRLDGATVSASGDFTGQLWHVRALPSGAFRLTNGFSGEGQSLAIADDGTPRMVTTGTGSAQSWRLSQIADTQFRLVNEKLGESLEADPVTRRLAVRDGSERIVQRWRIVEAN